MARLTSHTWKYPAQAWGLDATRLSFRFVPTDKREVRRRPSLEGKPTWPSSASCCDQFMQLCKLNHPESLGVRQSIQFDMLTLPLLLTPTGSSSRKASVDVDRRSMPALAMTSFARCRCWFLDTPYALKLCSKANKASYVEIGKIIVVNLRTGNY